jgi:hypothetical protein
MDYITVPPAAIDAAATVSPTMAEIAPAFSPGGAAMPWASPDRVIPGATFAFALRDAVASVGGFADGPTAQGYYQRIADEVNAACDDGRLECWNRPLIGALPVMSANDWSRLPGALWFTMRTSAEGFYDWPGAAESTDAPSAVGKETGMLFIFDQFLGRPWRTLSIPETEFFPGEIADGASHQLTAQRALWNIAHVVSPVIGVLGALGLVGGWVAMIRRRGWQHLRLALAAGAVVVMWLSRIAVIALTEATLFPAAHTLAYLLPSFPLYALACFLSLVLARRLIADQRRTRQEHVKTLGSNAIHTGHDQDLPVR